MSHPRRVTRSSTVVDKSRVARSSTPVYAFPRASSSAVEQGTLNHTLTARPSRAGSLANSTGRPPLPASPSPGSHVRPIPLYVERVRRVLRGRGWL